MGDVGAQAAGAGLPADAGGQEKVGGREGEVESVRGRGGHSHGGGIVNLLRRIGYLLPGRRRTEEEEMRAEFEALKEIVPARELGNLTLAAENARAVWGWTWLESFL